MPEIQFYFLRDGYYRDFPDRLLTQNRETVEGAPHKRPCFFAFADTRSPEILWLVPVSSKYDKYKRVYDKRVAKAGKCNTIVLGSLLGRRTAFLIQNMCPATRDYLIPYVNKRNIPIEVEADTARAVVRNAREVLAIEKRGTRVVYPDIMGIYERLRLKISGENQPDSRSR